MVTESDIQYAIKSFIQSFTFYESETITPGKLSDGMFFAGILTTVKKFKFASTLLNPKAQKWPNKLKNLKIIFEKIQQFFEEQIDKGIKTRDIDLVKIAKENNVQEINKFFQVIISVLMESANKQQYIQSIMQLDQRSQNAFVQIIKNSMDNRVCSKQQSHQRRMSQIIKQLQCQNINLKDQLDGLYKNNQYLQKQLKSYQQKMIEIQNQLDNSKFKRQQYNYQDSGTITQKYQKMLSNLKMKLISQSKDHQTQIATLLQRITQLQQTLTKMENFQEMAQFYKQKFEELSISMNKIGLWEKQKIKLLKIIDQKEISIVKMRQKLQQLTEKCLQLEENEIYHKMELKKYQTKILQAQKSLKNKINNNQTTMLMISQYQKINISKMCSEKQNILQSQSPQNHKLQAKMKQIQRQNSKLQRKLDKYKQIQLEKKKLQAIIVNINHNKQQQFQILTAALHQTYVENKKLWQAFRFRPSQ